jgi:hypothetical protein
MEMLQEYIFSWGNNEKRKTMKNRICIVLVRGVMNSALIKFLDNGQVECVSRNSLRKNKKAVGELFL